MVARSVLVAGASGVVGTAAVEEFAAKGWEVVAVSRRSPDVGGAHQFRHLPLDLRDKSACAAAVASLPPVSHVVYAAVEEGPDLRAGWQDPVQMQTNLAMLMNLLEPLAARGGLEHVTIMQGTKAYGAHLHRIPLPARERHLRDPHENFYWLQEDYLREKASNEGWAWTILRPQLVIGPNIGVSMNLPPVIGVYGAMRKAEGKPFSFPGGAPYISQAVDTRIVARAALWAAVAANARNQHFNVTNGEVFAWREIWPAMAEVLGIALGEDESISLVDYLSQRAGLWQSIARRHGLRQDSLDKVLGYSHHLADFQLAHGHDTPPRPTVVSTVKIRQAGFSEAMDTEESFQHWLRELQVRRIIPPHSSPNF